MSTNPGSRPFLLRVPNVPGDLKTALIREAEQTDVPLGVLAASILEDHFGLPRAVEDGWPAWRRKAKQVDGGQLTFPVSGALKQAVYADALASRRTQGEAVLGVLAGRYGIKTVPGQRRKGRST